MRWERRNSPRPWMAGLVCLVVLALATPYFCWQRPLLNVHALMAEQHAAQSARAQATQALPLRMPLEWDTLRGLCDKLEGILETAPARAIAATEPEPEAIPATAIREIIAVEAPPAGPPLLEAVPAAPAIPAPPAPFAAVPTAPAARRTIANSPGTIIRSGVPPRVAVESSADRLAMLLPRRPLTFQSTPTPWWELDTTPEAVLSAAERDPLRLAQRHPAATQGTTLPESTPVPQPAPQTEPTHSETAEPAEFAHPLIRRHPTPLVSLLEALAVIPATEAWATTALADVRQLTEATGVDPASAPPLLARLRQLATDGKAESLAVADPGLQQNWLQAAEGLHRRLGIWELLLATDRAASTTPAAADDQLVPVLSDIAALLEGTPNGAEWREYLLLDQIALATSAGVADQRPTRTKLAQEVLSRMDDQRLTPEQQEFLATAPLAQLHRKLQPWAAGPVDLNTLLALVERYEVDRQLRYAAAIAQYQQRLRWSAEPQLQAVAAEMHEAYRGANMRLAISKELLNRLVPDQNIVTAPVRETVAGKRVQGRSRTSTDVSVALLPAEGAWRIGLEADGKVYSRTRSETWPVKVHNAARYEYEAEKVITLDAQGMQVSRAVSEARGRNEFLGADSQFDRVPLLGAMFRGLGKQQNQKKRPQAASQVKAKVAHEARTRMDQEADPKLSQLEAQFRDQVLTPFGNLALVAEPVSMYSTRDRAVMQLRLANLDQLAAHTPRPSAPGDSLLSIQLHETALNNALAGLELEGRRLKLPELHALLAEKLGQGNVLPPDDLPARAVIEFAAHDAVHIAFVEDRLELVLNIHELAYGRDKIPNFQVHTFYLPQVDGLTVRLVRDDTLQFDGRALRTGHRVVLHSVMGKLFHKGEEIAVFKQKLQSDPRLKGLMVTQLVIEDGWLALALGPASAQRTAWRTPSYQFETDGLR